ncbi:hypothetical protein ABTK95_19145 [Acinetobacter baumannii]
MDSDVPQKMSGLFNAFKSSIAKTKRPQNQLSNKVDDEVHSKGIQIIRRSSDIEPFNAEIISIAIGKAFAAVEGCDHHIRTVLARVALQIKISEDRLNTLINSYFSSDLFSVEGALKLTAASQALSIFKRLKEITLSVIFTTTRNFSIQKNLSISA